MTYFSCMKPVTVSLNAANKAPTSFQLSEGKIINDLH